MLGSRRFRAGLFVIFMSLVLGFGKVAFAGEIILNDLSGQAVDISSYKGKPVILFFWTTWCPYCREELKRLNQQYPAILKEGMVVFGVNVRESESRVKNFFKGYPLNFKILLDRSGWLADKYDLMGVPTFIFLDKAGEVILRTNSLPDNFKS